MNADERGSVRIGGEVAAMTEDQWLAVTDPKPMLELLRDWPRDRKLRLFACDCCRRIWHRTTELDRAVVAAIERCADGLIPAAEILATAGVPPLNTGYPAPFYHVTGAEAERVVAEAALPHTWTGASRARAFVVDAVRRAEGPDGRAAEWRRQSDALRCIFGNPFRPLTVDLSWLTSTVLILAQGIYDDSAFDRLPILADALQDAGCDSAEVLGHCRGLGPHARGCWVVDLLLGKS
jgi:hypothetical protein